MDVSSLAPFSNAICPVCGNQTRVKREFGPYVLARRHAVGGMSMVFVAHDQTLDREVALKILSEEYSADERRIKAFEEEARITASFSHPHVVRVLTTGKAFGRFYIAMELVPGGHFEHQIRERGKIPEFEMLPLAIEVAQGLKAAHSAGLIHRDVKPGNILLDAEGHAKIVDFGLALVTQGGLAQATEIWATPYYVPPETIEGYPEDFRSDIYAFGATLYHALIGRPSCDEETMATEILRAAKKKVVSLGDADPSLSAAICKIVDRAMAYHPADRYCSYDELIRHLEGALKRLKSTPGGEVESSGHAVQRKAREKLSRRLRLLALGVIFLLMLLVGVIGLKSKVAVPPPTVKPMQVIPPAPLVVQPDSSAIDVAKLYREARAAVKARDFAKAAAAFAKLRDDSQVQEPTRSWSGIEAVIANYLDGQSTAASEQAKLSAEHALSVPEAGRLGKSLIDVLARLAELPGIPSKELDVSDHDAAHVLAWMLAGLKDWEQGMMEEASGYFSAVAKAQVSKNEQWLEVYQSFAKDYLADQQTLSSAVFAKLPTNVTACKTAIGELDGILKQLKTRGRARYNVRAWQLDLAKQAKLLAVVKVAPVIPVDSVWEPTAVMGKLGSFARDCRFADATVYLQSFEMTAADPMRSSLLSLTKSSGTLFDDLERILLKNPIREEFLMKPGKSVRKIFINSAKDMTITDSKGKTERVKWSDFSPEAIIALYRILVKNSSDEEEILQLHQGAVGYYWLVGNHKHALAAAELVSQSNEAFKKHWNTIARDLPK